MLTRLKRLASLALVLCLTILPIRVALAADNPPDFAAIDAYIAAQMKAIGIPGLALGIIHGDQIVYVKGYGVADPSGRAVTAQTPFWLASLAKSVTALAIMQLVEAGKIELDAPVQRYLPYFRVAAETESALDESSTITVRH